MCFLVFFLQASVIKSSVHSGTLPQRRYSKTYSINDRRSPSNALQCKANYQYSTAPCENRRDNVMQQILNKTHPKGSPTAGGFGRTKRPQDSICDGKESVQGSAEQAFTAGVFDNVPVNVGCDNRNVECENKNVAVQNNTINSVSSSASMLLDDPKLQSRRFLQRSKASKLLDYGIAPCQSPLNSPIPDTVRKAFKPPSISSASKSTTRTKQVTMNADKENDIIKLDLDSKLKDSEYISENRSSTSTIQEVGSKETDESVKVTNALRSVEINTTGTSPEYANTAEMDSQDSCIVSDGSQASNTDNVSTDCKNMDRQRKSRRKGYRTESSDPCPGENTSPVTKRRSSLRLRKK